ncbi:SPW repeat-containing protein [Krasilnikoviella flava]|uniref:SPW repeat-containing protein n=2 Tax=Krasilnikoviella flava TaxID=526729 RepID=A0A1T5LJ93_9MICO|nr:SPW repeat-containing protein [Krasilnikoviella flava]
MTRRERRLMWTAIIVGAVLVVLGVYQASTWSFAFGWFAYAPLSDTTFHPRIPNFWVPPALIGVGATLVGLGGGFLLGRRRG